MGLDITAHEYAAITPPHAHVDDCYERGHVHTFVISPLFEQSLRGLKPNRHYAVSGKVLDFRAGSYGGYNDLRNALSQSALGVSAHEVFEHPALYRERPFFELINFADNEGTIGPEACADLAEDFRSQRDAILPKLEENDPTGYYGQKYDKWLEAFELAAGSGLVEFS